MTVQADPNNVLLVGTSQDATVASPVVESDRTALALLKKLAVKYGYAFNLKYGQLRFESFELLASRAAVKTYSFSDLSPGSRYASDATGTLKSALTLYQSTNNATISYVDNNAYKQDSITIDNEGYYRNIDSALLRSKGALRESNLRQSGAKINVEGEVFLYAGRRILLLDSTGTFLNYLIDRAYHRLDSKGWLCSLDLILL